MRFPIGSMSMGDVLDRALKLLLARLPVYYAIHLIVLSPQLLLVFAMPFVGPQAILVLGMFSLFASLVLGPLGSAALLYLILEEYIGRPATISEAFSFAGQRFMPLLGTSILSGLIIMVGFILCIVPGVYFAVSYLLVSQVVVLEGLSGMPALERSKKLIEGHRGRVFGVLLLVGIAVAVVSGLLGAGLNAALPTQEFVPGQMQANPFGPGQLPVTQIKPANFIVVQSITQLVNILFQSYLAVCSTLLYLDLRIRKEGFDLELAAQSAGQPGEDLR